MHFFSRIWLVALIGLVGVAWAAGSAAVQPSFDVLTVHDADGDPMAYAPWVAWSPPAAVRTPDGGAWAVFSAEALESGSANERGHLYAARFDPATATWSPAAPLPGGAVQMGASMVVDSRGVVHVVYTDRGDGSAPGTLGYTKNEGPGWSQPVPVSLDANAGAQLFPALVIGEQDQLVVIWQDQRLAAPAERELNALAGDLFVSTLVDGLWSAAEPVVAESDPATYPGRPLLVNDGSRLVAVWSVYQTADPDQSSAVVIAWSSRGLSAGATWAPPRDVVRRNADLLGGRLVALGSDGAGSVHLVWGRRAAEITTLSLRSLSPGAADWSEDRVLIEGDTGNFPSLLVELDGRLVVAYEIGTIGEVRVGVLTVDGGVIGSEEVLTEGLHGAQGRPVVFAGPSGEPAVCFVQVPETGGIADEVRCQRSPTLGATPGASPVTSLVAGG